MPFGYNAIAFCILLSTMFAINVKTAKTTVAKTKEEILTTKTWIVKEAVDMQEGVYHHYKRGSTDNTNNLDGDELTFQDDHSGTYRDATGSVYSLTWNFTNEEQTEMNVVIRYPSPVTLHYEMMRIEENEFSATHTYFNGIGNRVLASFHRVYKFSDCKEERRTHVQP